MKIDKDIAKIKLTFLAVNCEKQDKNCDHTRRVRWIDYIYLPYFLHISYDCQKLVDI